jgi:hypothetical protein
MADQTIEIKLVLRDELTRQLQPIIAQLKQLNSAVDGAKFQQASQHAQHFGRTIQVVRRELSTLASLTFGGIIGGGVVAGIVATGKALSDMAGRGLQLGYIADSLGTQAHVLNEFSDAFMGLGKSQEEGAAAIQGASKALRELQIEGRESGLFKELERTGGASGRRIAQEMAREMAGPRGLQGGLEHALRRMANMGQADAAKFGQVLGFGPGFGRQAARDYLEVLGQLPKRLELPRQQALDLAKANAAWGISWDNIKTTLAAAFIPTFAKITQSLDEFLQSPSGQNFAVQLEFWGWLMAKAVDEWLKGGGLQRAAKGLEETVGYLKTGFEEADKVIKAMDLSWPQVIAGMIGLKLLGPILRSIGVSLSVLAAIPGILPLLAALGLSYAAALYLQKIKEQNFPEGAPDKPSGMDLEFDPFSGKETTVWDRLRRRGGGSILDGLRKSMQDSLGITPQQQSGEETPKTEPERRADLDEKKRANRELTREFAALEYEMTKLNAYIQPGGPEGGGGTSGFQNDLSPGAFQTMMKGGVFANQYSTVVDTAAKYGLPASLMASILGFETGYGKSGKSQPPYNNPAGLMGGGYLNRTHMQFPTLEEGIDKAGEVQKRIYEQGGRAIAGMAGIYAPVGAKNDPHRTNAQWPGSVTSIQNRLIDRGFDPGGLQDAVPGVGAGAGGGQAAGFDDRFNPIINHLASRDRATVNGSATVDIDVGGLGQSSRNPSSLFRPVPLGGIEQMQNITRPENNPLSQQ